MLVIGTGQNDPGPARAGHYFHQQIVTKKFFRTHLLLSKQDFPESLGDSGVEPVNCQGNFLIGLKQMRVLTLFW